MKTTTTAYRSVLRIGLATSVVLLVPYVAMQFTEEVNWTAFDFGLAAVLLGAMGLLLELLARRPGKIAYRVAPVALGAVAIAAGEADDAPGLVLFGLLLIAATIALTIRATRRSA